MSENKTAIFWFRDDLRLSDNPGLGEAIKSAHLIPVFIWSPKDQHPWQLGEASQWWLHHSLNHLQEKLKALGSDLIILTGNYQQSLDELASSCNATHIYWNRTYRPHSIERDKSIKAHLKGKGYTVESFPGNYLFEPWELLKDDDTPYKVYTALWKKFVKSKSVRKPFPNITSLPPLPSPLSLKLQRAKAIEYLSGLDLLPKIKWDGLFYEYWKPGEDNAHGKLKSFNKSKFKSYSEQRNIPGEAGTSELSPHLRFGEITPQQIWDSVVKKHGDDAIQNTKVNQYLKELVWREFSSYLLFHFPELDHAPMRPEFHDFPWKKNPAQLRLWQKGLTGYPIVDAGMRELWKTGWMHNRVRMIVASFLVKDLLIPWQEGAKWFWDTLVDADLASNTQGWQWTAGCGADAAPYFRVFNPTLQGEKFDPEGIYIKKWIPELANMPAKWIHKPWESPKEDLANAGVILGETYPKPIVDHHVAKQQALQAYNFIKKQK